MCPPAPVTHRWLVRQRRARQRRARQLLAVCAVVLAMLTMAFAGSAADKEDEAEVNHVDLAAKMIADGHYDRAEQVLAEVDPQGEGVDRKKLFTLRGVVYLKKGLYSASVESFEAAIVAGQTEPVVHLYLAQGHFGLKAYPHCLRELSLAGEAAAKAPEAYLMRAEANWRLERPAEAVGALDEGLGRFPEADDMLRMKIFLLAELGLYQEVVDLGAAYLAREDVTQDDYLALGEALRAGRQHEEAQLLLERARLTLPDSNEIAVQLAHSYLDDQKPAVAAMLFEDAARRDPKYHFEAAELYKQASRIDRATRINARVSDPKAKLKQRLSLLLSAEHFEQIAAMAPVLSRFNLLADEDVRYALAFAFFNTGQFRAAERTLQRIQSSHLFEASVELRKAIDSCRQAGWECRQ